MPAVEIRVPATTTNLGPGFDCLGMALALHNRMTLEAVDGAAAVEIRGEGESGLARDRSNLVYRAAERLYREAGRAAPSLRIRMENRIPVSRGLGSSSAAIVGGLVGANALLGAPFDREEILHLAVEMEGHPDNVTPALLGGLQVMSPGEQGLIHLRLPVPPGLRAVVCIPDTPVSTTEARRVLPERCSRADAVFNIGRAALLVGALATGRTGPLAAAMDDRLHQPYRAALVPGFEAALRAALEAGAAGACLSGSGSSMLALTTGEPEPVGRAMAAAVRAAGAEARWLAPEIDPDGAVTRVL